jgi:Cu/Ag efflux pump CusA
VAVATTFDGETIGRTAWSARAEEGRYREEAPIRSEYRAKVVDSTRLSPNGRGSRLTIGSRQGRRSDKLLPPGFRLQIAGEYEKQQGGFGEMTMVLLISVALIFLALTVQFQNAIKPFIVFGAIPYGFVGAVAGL